MSDEMKTVIKVGMNTSEVATSVADVNRRLKLLDSEFAKTAEEAKLFGKESELLAKKQQTLTEKIQLQSSKVNKLKADMEKAKQEKGQDAKATQNLTLRYNEAEKALFKMQKELKDTSEKIEKQSSHITTLTNRFVEFERRSSKTLKQLNSLANGFLTMGAAIIGASGASAKLAMSLEEGVAKVSTIADADVFTNSELENGIIALSNLTGKTTEEMSEALYETISAGVNTAESFQFLFDASKTARGGFTGVTDSVDTLTSVLNAYEMETKNTMRISDQLFVMQNFGKTTIGQMGTEIGRVAPLASKLNVSTNELFSSLAVLTKNGIKSNEAITGMKAALSNIIKPTAEAEEAARRIGLRFNSSTLQSKGFASFLDEVVTKSKGNVDVLAELFGSIEAVNNILVLTSANGSKDFDNAMSQMENSTGMTNEAFEKMNTSGMRFEQTLQRVKNSVAKAGQAFIPIFEKILNVITPIVTLISKMNPALLQMIVTFGMMMAAGGGIIKMFTGTVGAVKNITDIMGSFNVKTLKTIGIILAVVAALSILIGLITILAGKSGEVERTMESIGRSASNMTNNVQIPTYAVDGSHRSGLKRVPFDGYVAELHRNEEVLRADDPRNQNNNNYTTNNRGGDIYNVTIDAKNVREFNNAVNFLNSIKQTARAGEVGG